MNHEMRFTAEKIRKRLALVQENRFRNRLPLDPLLFHQLPDARTDPPLEEDTAAWKELPWNDYWGGADCNYLLRGHFTVPSGWSGQAAFWFPFGEDGDIFHHPESLLYVEGNPIGSIDRNHHTINIPEKFVDGSKHRFSMHGWTGMFGYPPDADSKEKLFLPQCYLVERVPPLYEFLTLAECALQTAEHLDGDRQEPPRILNALDEAFLALDTTDPLGERLYTTAPKALKVLQQGLKQAGPALDVTLHCIGHAHMDIAYLWPIDQIRRKNARTYSNVLRLMERHKDYRFSHSQPALYEMTSEDFPEIFEGIKTRVKEGRWEVIGGMWVEPDANLPCGESLVRQIVLGRNYFRKQFGDVEPPVLWLPDTFGFPWSLPQLMMLAGLDYFVTSKINWNQYNPMPSSTTWWQGIDGTKVLAHFLTTPGEVDHLPFPTNYKSGLAAWEVAGTWERSTTKAEIKELPICYGYGDGGGGPTEELLRRARSYAEMPGMPQLKMSNVRSATEALSRNAEGLPVWNAELYMEGHRGVLTSQAWIKKALRKTEIALHETEALLVKANPSGVPEPVTSELTSIWKKLCINQFHDILAGTAITQVFEDARRDFEEMAERIDVLKRKALKGLSSAFENTSPHTWTDPVLLPGNEKPPTECLAQTTEHGVLLDLPAIPAYGSLSPANLKTPSEPADQATVGETGNGYWLENGFVRVDIDKAGNVVRMHDKSAGREILAEGEHGNQLWAYEDRPIAWDAWDIDVFYSDRAELIGGVDEIEIVEKGPLRAAVRVGRNYRNSRIVQDIRIIRGSPRVEFATTVDWHDTHFLLKAAFPVDVLNPRATYGIQWGHLERATHRSNSWDFAKFESPAHGWAELGEGGFGVALLNDCKYGYGIMDNVMHLSLIKSSTAPDPVADQGRHEFTYALFSHQGSLAEVRREANALNHRPTVVTHDMKKDGKGQPPLVTCDSPNIVIETVKPAEDGRGYIVRMYESNRQRGRARLEFPSGLKSAEIVNLLEEKLADAELDGSAIAIDYKPFQIISIRCVPAKSP